jgi:hypothetical protein
MARAWQAILGGLRWGALLCVVGGGSMFVVGMLTDFRSLAGTGFLLAGGVSLLVGAVYCGVFAADESRYRRTRREDSVRT